MDSGEILKLLLGLLVCQPNLVLQLVEGNSNDFLKREHSLVKPYQGSGFGVPNWDFQGSTMVTSNYIRLTPDDRSRQGALWNKIPCRVRNWEVQINFKVTGTTKDLFGDGFAFWYTKELSIFENNDDLGGTKIDVTRMPAGADNPPSLKISHNT